MSHNSDHPGILTQPDDPETPVVLVSEPNHHVGGFVVAGAVSLLLHVIAFGAVVYWADWFGFEDGTVIPEYQTIVVLGNVGGSARSVRGNPAGSNEPAPLPPNTPVESIKPAPPPPPPPKPTLSVDDVKRSMTEAQQWLSRTTPQLPAFAKPDITLVVPDLPTATIREAWQKTADWAAEQLPKLKKPEPKPTPSSQSKKTEPAKSGERQEPKLEPKSASARAPEPPKKAEPAVAPSEAQGNAEYNGTNRNGSGNVGSGGNNNGIDAAARPLDSNIAPPYPYEADRLNLEGIVKVLIAYDRTGRITKVALHTSSGSTLLDGPVLDHVQRNWVKVHPRLDRGRPVAGELIVPFTFRKT